MLPVAAAKRKIRQQAQSTYLERLGKTSTPTVDGCDVGIAKGGGGCRREDGADGRRMRAGERRPRPDHCKDS